MQMLIAMIFLLHAVQSRASRVSVVHAVWYVLGYGGGWGYSGHSIEAIRFSCDADVLLGGFALFGGRGEYFAKIRVR